MVVPVNKPMTESKEESSMNKEDQILSAIEKIGGKIEKLEENQNRMFDAIDTLSGRVGQLEGRMGRVETALSRMDDRLLLQQKNIADLTECVKHLDTQTEENVRYISALMKGQADMEDTVRNNHDAVCNRLDFFKDDFKQWKDITAQHSTEIMYLKRTTEKIAQ